MGGPFGTRSPNRRQLLTTALGATAAVGVTAGGARATTPAAPQRTATILGREVDVSHATPEVVRLFGSYFEAKSAGDVTATMAHFARDMTYVDATLGWSWYSWQDLYDLFAQLMPTWPSSAASYPTRILGDTRSALVCFTDTPELFGHEIRPLGAVDFRNGKIVRWIDYWDGRAFTLAGIQEQRTPAAQFPTDFGEEKVGERAETAIRTTVQKLSGALSSGDVSLAASLVHPDVVFEDLALHVCIGGRVSLEAYWASALGQLPYGAGSALRHVVGGAWGGGYEWVGPSAAPRGNTALVVDEGGLVKRFTAVWDSSLWTADAIGRLQVMSVLQ
ncbi:nuclear transport factor 2-like protein [Actinacidiphila guanduensis]|uniref:SnoaL-like domain-containing protein n=1 Tax=Actinacidiphila guanduensis TaxID=310781 RepID=A0A1H0S137_9ACTN|nr:hypothetical protein [Actinacidiphila guanduensis]SDP35423.1 hypothetical protein SAMN05216259_12511 [Actinacidiphila guanduensis]